MHKDLNDAISVPFDSVFLDPNNPRVAPEERPGYEDPKLIFDAEVQSGLNGRIAEVYDVPQLEHSILTQGWVPIDSILVWEHHKKKGHYIVVEGNTRTVALRRIRERVEREKEKLARMKEKGKKYAEKEIQAQERLLAQLQQIIKDTDKLLVYPVNAKTPEELEEKLPRLLGVRHVTHARDWTPYATNLYMLSLYTKLFEEKYPGQDLALKPELIESVGDMVSTGETKTRRNIQAASAFSHFKANYEDKLTDGDTFGDEDQYHFENILQNKYAQTQFGFGKDDLQLSPEMEAVLFKWGFVHPRGDGDENRNIFRKAEDIRLWAKMKRYDNDHGTTFADQIDVENPDDARPMAELEAEFLARKAQISPLNTLRSLLQSFRDLRADTLKSQASHLRPMLEELCEQGQEYIQMIDAVSDGKVTRSLDKGKSTAKSAGTKRTVRE